MDLPGDSIFTPGEFFQGFIGFGIIFPSQNGLNSFCYNGPVIFQVMNQFFFIQYEFGESFLNGFKSKNRM